LEAKVIGSGYYGDPGADDLLRRIVAYLRSKIR
jgi:hypothetical protein